MNNGRSVRSEGLKDILVDQILPDQPQLWAYARRLGGICGIEPEDLIQEAYLRFLSCGHQPDLEKPRAFISRIIKNIALDAIRRRKVVSIETSREVEMLAMPCNAPDQERIVISRQSLQRLMIITEGLPPQCRKAFTLRKIYGLNAGEIAEVMGISVSTVEKHLAKGLRICTERMKDPSK